MRILEAWVKALSLWPTLWESTPTPAAGGSLREFCIYCFPGPAMGSLGRLLTSRARAKSYCRTIETKYRSCLLASKLTIQCRRPCLTSAPPLCIRGCPERLHSVDSQDKVVVGASTA